MFSVPVPEAQENPQTRELCDKLAIDDPVSLIDQESGASLKISDITMHDADQDLTYEITKNEDEIELDDESDDEDAKESAKKGTLLMSYHESHKN